MTQLESLQAMTGESDTAVLSTYLKLAGDRILARCYPYGQCALKQVPAKYASLQLEIACLLLNKRGAEGESEHNEDGVDRQYESIDSMLKDVTPFATAIG